ncbi:MAG TPA: DUF5666 domain-containing protein, partial [Roseiflexaceae bacterium]|nr:DUF5666 domain-containing protein [Roseiflexaceae bacterium]
FMVILMAVLALVLVGGATGASAAPGGRGPGRGPGGQGAPGGEVTAVSSNSITVSSPRGAATITTTASTTYQVNGAAGSLSDVKVGMYVRAEGTAGTNSFTATRVVASTEKPAQPGRPGRGLGGDATAINGSTITINTPRGSVKIVTSASTTYQVNGAAGSLSDIQVGMFVCAEGTTAGDGTITATRVIASNTKPARPQQ